MGCYKLPLPHELHLHWDAYELHCLPRALVYFILLHASSYSRTFMLHHAPPFNIHQSIGLVVQRTDNSTYRAHVSHLLRP
uniref:Expressed protein n=1 Tax=Schizophyllum commune (strain H4-8 / FGSC 9210) TaxID=578458 RepID=D8PTI0_SCHCM